MNNTPIILSTKKSIEGYQTISIKNADFLEIINNLIADKQLQYHLYHKKEERLLALLYTKLPVVIAGGGKVYNHNNEVLFIYRNGKWDLPKGKMEKKEDIETTALREVEEETGVSGLEITKFLYKTFHVFKRNDEYRLKVTYWFEMTTDFEDEVIPQLEEDITKVKWKSKKKIKKALQNSYANIKLLFSHEYLS